MNTRVGYQPGSTPDNNVITFLERHAASDGGRIALVGGGERLDYASLVRRSRALAAGLAGLGLVAGDRAFVFMPMSPTLYVALFAVQRLGAIPVFLDAWSRREQFADCARAVRPRAFIGNALTTGLARDLAAWEILVSSGACDGAVTLEDLVAADGSAPVAAVAGEDTALITFTTGSSGTPKGADRTHRFLAAQHEALAASLPYQSGEVDLPVFPIFSLNNLAAGITTVMPACDLARPSPTDGATLAGQLAEQRCSTATLSPGLLRAVCAHLAASTTRLPHLRRVATGGAPIGPADVAAFRAVLPQAVLHILYGSTEVEPIAGLEAHDMPAGDERSGVCVGTPVAGLSWRLIRPERGPVVLGADGWEAWDVAPGEPGELIVAGEHVCPGYWHDEEATARGKIADGPRRWHRTGDICRADAEGRLWMLGRVHSTVVRAGRLLFPVGPELALRRVPGVQVAAYLGLPDGELGERAVVAVQPNEGADPQALIAAVRAALAALDAVVDEIRLVAAIPLDPRHHSKVEYAVLRARLLDASA